jgi:hypothetical protein
LAPEIEHRAAGLDDSRITREKGARALCAARETHDEELGALGPEMREGGQFSARNRDSSPEGSITVISVQ